MEETREIDIDLRKIVYMMRKKIIFIVLATALLGAIAGCFTHFFIEPTYSASVKMFVYSNTDRASSDTSINKDEISASRELINTYIYVLKSDTVLEKVADDLDLNDDPDITAKIRSMINASVIEDTQAFQVTVSSNDRNLAAKIANSIAKTAPEEIVRVVKAGGVEIIDYAKVPKNPSSPNTKKNIMVGALAGFIVSFLGFFVYEIFDTTITNAKDLERDFNIPILGTIPRLESVERATETESTVVQSVTPKAESVDPPKPAAKPSSTVLENIQAMKGDAKDEK